MATNTIGAAGNFTTIAAWASAVKAIGTLAEDEVGQLIDDAVYTRGATSDLDFSGVTLSGFTITLNVAPGVRHDGDFGNGARVEVSSASGGVYQVKNCIIEDMSFYNTLPTGNGGRVLYNIEDAIIRRTICKTDTDGSNSQACAALAATTTPATFESVRTVGGSDGIEMSSNGVHTALNCSSINSTGVGISNGGGDTKNCVCYNNVGADFQGTPSGAYNNCASEDGTAVGSTNAVLLVGDPFDPDGFTPAASGQLDGAGIAAGVITDAANNPFASPPSIGAYEVAGVGPTVPVLSNPTQPVYTP